MAPENFNATLNRDRETTRKFMFQLIAQKIPPPATWQAVRDNMVDSVSYTVFQELLIAVKPYTSTAPTDRWTEAEQRAIQITQMTVVLLDSYHVESFCWLLDELAEILLKNISAIDTCSESVRKIKERLDDYAEKTYMALKDIDDNGDIDDDLSTSFDKSGLRLNSTTSTSYLWSEFTQDDPVWWNDFNPKIKKIGDYMKSSSLDPSVLRYLLNQDLGSCGMYTEQLSGSVLMAPFLPIKNREHIRRQATAYAVTLRLVSDPEDADDEYQQHLEDRMKNYIRSRSWSRFAYEAAFRSVTATNNPTQSHTPSGATHTGTSTSGSTRRSRRTGRRSTQSGQPSGTNPSTGSTQSPPQPTLPDDSTYEPDGVLASLAQDFTKAALLLDPTDMTHDHLTRFNTQSYSSTTLTEYQKRFGRNADWTIMESTNLGFQEFVITFTRQSKKPIFNPIV